MSKKIPFNLRFDRELLDELKDVSIKEGISMTEIIEVAVKNYVPVLKKHMKTK